MKSLVGYLSFLNLGCRYFHNSCYCFSFTCKTDNNHLKDHLPGGLNKQPSEKLKQETGSVA